MRARTPIYSLPLIAALAGCAGETLPSPAALVPTNTTAIPTTLPTVDSVDSTVSEASPTIDSAASGVSRLPSGSAAMPTILPTIDVAVASWEDLQAEIARHRGQVVVVDLWSSWCPPCVREFPQLVELQSQHRQDMACISFNVNYSGLAAEPPESFREDVLAFLNKEQATITNFISSVPDTDLYKQLDLGAVPAVLVYDREGRLQKRFDNDANAYGADGFTYRDHVAPLVAELLNP